MENIGYILSENSRHMRRSFDDCVREIGITAQQARLLLTVQRHPGQNQGFYADRLEVEPITLCRMIDRMEQSGTIERKPDPADRRAQIPHLSRKGENLVAQIEPRLAAILGDMLSGIPQNDLDKLASMLEIIRQNLVRRRNKPEAADG